MSNINSKSYPVASSSDQFFVSVFIRSIARVTSGASSLNTTLLRSVHTTHQIAAKHKSLFDLRSEVGGSAISFHKLITSPDLETLASSPTNLNWRYLVKTYSLNRWSQLSGDTAQRTQYSFTRHPLRISLSAVGSLLRRRIQMNNLILVGIFNLHSLSLKGCL